MNRQPRATLIEQEPSTAYMVKTGKREHEKVLLTADGVSCMVNEDGSIRIELYTDDKRIGIHLSPDDAKSQVHVFRRWQEFR
jgi:hypothetical protein